MLYLIYSVYLDSLAFLWKNFLIVIPYFMVTVLSFGLGKIITGTSLPEEFIVAIFPLFLFGTAEILITVVAYTKIVFEKGEYSFWDVFKAYFEKAMLLLITVSFVVIFTAAIFSVFVPVLDGFIRFFGIITVLFVGAFSLRQMIFYNNDSIYASIKSGLKDIHRNFLFYVLFEMASVVILSFPSLLFFARWLNIPILTLVEHEIRSGPFLWLNWILSSVFYTLHSIAITYAFICKNRNKFPRKLHLDFEQFKLFNRKS